MKTDMYFLIYRLIGLQQLEGIKLTVLELGSKENAKEILAVIDPSLQKLNIARIRTLSSAVV